VGKKGYFGVRFYNCSFNIRKIFFANFLEKKENGIGGGGVQFDRQQKIFPQQKRIIRIMTCLSSSTPC